MGGSRRITWLVFIVGVIAVVDVLGWVTWRVLRLEREQARSQAEATRQEAMGRALWRMDSIVLPLLAVESARPYFEYMAFYPANRPFDRMWAPPAPGDVPVPSPLLGEAGDFALLHFERSPDGTLTSPQAPATEQARQAAARAGVPPALLARAEIRLYELERIQRGGLAGARAPATTETLLGATVEHDPDALLPRAGPARANRAASVDDNAPARESVAAAGLSPEAGAQSTPPRVTVGVPMSVPAESDREAASPAGSALGDEARPTRPRPEQSEPVPAQVSTPIQSTEETRNAALAPPPTVVGDERQDYAARQMAVTNATQAYNDAGRANNRFRTQGDPSRVAQPAPDPIAQGEPERPASLSPAASAPRATEFASTRSPEARESENQSRPGTDDPVPAAAEPASADGRAQERRIAGEPLSRGEARNEALRAGGSPGTQPDSAADATRAFLEQVESAIRAEAARRDRESAAPPPGVAIPEQLNILAPTESNTVATLRVEPPHFYELAWVQPGGPDSSIWLAPNTGGDALEQDAASSFEPFDDSRVAAGPLIPTWIGAADAAEPALLLVRRVTIDDQARDQGVWIDWPALRASLEASVADLFPFAEVRPLAGPPAAALVGDAQRLATIPAVLIPGPLSPALAPTPASLWTPTRATLLVGWIAVAIAVVSIGIVLRKAIDLGERRGRFVSAVTHELRTPLTTFRLYSQMLASGQVADEAKRTRYAQTLDRESQRLSGIVESVLEYARLGRRSGSATMQRVTAAELIDRVRPTLLGRAERAGMALELPPVETLPAASVRADADRVERILLNLVDNACKYACDADDKRIELTAEARDGRLLLTVRDHGPGVPPPERARIFAAFHRAKHHESSPSPGLGLGLALSRGLAREMNGDLRLLDEPTGAAFELSLPLTP